MTAVYLIRHSIKDKNYGKIYSNDSKQIQDERMYNHIMIY